MANLGGLGDYIRDQRETSRISLRQLARLAGVSNPYLSQIERGLRKPSAEILQQLAKALRVSAEAMYVQAGILEERAGGDVAEAVRRDPALTDRQRQVLLEIYDSFRRENDATAESVGGAGTVADSADWAAADPVAAMDRVANADPAEDPVGAGSAVEESVQPAVTADPVPAPDDSSPGPVDKPPRRRRAKKAEGTGTAPAGTAPAGTAPAGTAPAGTAPAGTAPAGTPRRTRRPKAE